MVEAGHLRLHLTSSKVSVLLGRAAMNFLIGGAMEFVDTHIASVQIVCNARVHFLFRNLLRTKNRFLFEIMSTNLIVRKNTKIEILHKKYYTLRAKRPKKEFAGR